MLPALLLLALSMLIMARRMPFRLIWRTRWLLLVLLFGYAYSLPGAPVLTLLAEFSPSWEGLRHGMEQAARLTVLLLWLDILVLRLSSEALLAGLLQLIRPFSIIGLDPRRAALRLGLTLRAIEGMERGRGNVRSLLELDYEPDLPQRIQLNLLPLRAIDLAIPGLLFIGLLSQWMITL
jgi:energy-coupling factor transporter transmembrane protein EcfT